MSSGVVYVIACPLGGYVDRGGRRTHTITQVRLFKTKERAEAYIDEARFVVNWQEDELYQDCKVVPISFEIGELWK